MSVRTTLATIALLAFYSVNANAQTDFFWSFKGLNSGATNSDADGTFHVGDTGTLFLYYSTANSQLDTGAGLDLSLTNSDLIEFTSAETFDFQINLSGAPIGHRWQDENGGGFAGDAQEVNTDTIVGLNAYTITQLGIFGVPPFHDGGYDHGADAFLFGRVDFIVAEQGTTEISTAVGSIGIVHDGQSLNPTFGNATITVVPEPTSGCLIAMGLLGFSVVRRRLQFP